MKKNASKKHSKKALTIGIAIVLVLLIGVLTLLTGEDNDPETLSVSASGELMINADDVTATASFYPYESNGTYMEVIAVRANDGTVRTALNTCQVCYNSGRGYYEQLGDVLICNNCGNRFTIDQIELIKGGCNPVPIFDEMKSEDNGIIAINPDALAYYEPLFANWKKP